jgi:hypothetical protein
VLTFAVDNEYVDDKAPLPLVARSSLRETGTSRAGTPISTKRSYEFLLRHAAAGPDTRLARLSGYGISEPANPNASRRIWLYVNLLIGVLIIILVFVAYRRRQGNLAQAVPA